MLPSLPHFASRFVSRNPRPAEPINTPAHAVVSGHAVAHNGGQGPAAQTTSPAAQLSMRWRTTRYNQATAHIAASPPGHLAVQDDALWAPIDRTRGRTMNGARGPRQAATLQDLFNSGREDEAPVADPHRRRRTPPLLPSMVRPQTRRRRPQVLTQSNETLSPAKLQQNFMVGRLTQQLRMGLNDVDARGDVASLQHKIDAAFENVCASDILAADMRAKILSLLDYLNDMLTGKQPLLVSEARKNIERLIEG